LLHEGGHDAVRRRAVGRVGDGLALGIFQRLDRRSRRHIPEKVGRAGGFGTDDADRRAFGVQGERAHDAAGHAEIRAAGDHGLLRLAGALRPQDLEDQAMLLEDPRTLADFRD